MSTYRMSMGCLERGEKEVLEGLSEGWVGD